MARRALSTQPKRIPSGDMCMGPCLCRRVQAITAARSLADDLAANVPITRKHLSETFTRLTGATDADNRWSLSDTHASVELAQLLYLQATLKITPGSNMAAIITAKAPMTIWAR